MIGRKTDNTVKNASGVQQAGRDIIGIPPEQHERVVNQLLAELRSDLDEKHKALRRAESAELRVQVAELEKQLAEQVRRAQNPEDAYAEYQERIAKLEELLEEATVDIGENRIRDAQIALDEGDSTKADEIFDEVIEADKAAVNRMASAFYGKGLIAEEKVRWNDAAGHFVRAAELTPDFEHLFKARQYLWRAGRFDEALSVGRKLLAQVISDTPARRGQVLNEHAVSLFSAGLYDEAEPLFREALQIGRETLGARHPDCATRLHNLASLLRAMGRYNQAEPLFREALEIDRETVGARHPTYASGLNSLAGLLEATGRYDEAEPLFREVLEIDRETVGSQHPAYAIHLNNLALLLRATGRYDEAESLFREALEIDRETVGARHPDYAVHLNNLALLLHATGRYDEAEPLYREALEIDRETLGARHPDYATHLNNLAVLLEGTGRLDEAEPLYRGAIDILEATLGPDHPNTKSAKENLADLIAKTASD